MLRLGQGTPTITFTSGASGNVHFVVAATGAGPCYPSQVEGHATILPSPDASLGAGVRGCIGITANLRASLTGTPPFIVRWSDGLVQSEIQSDSVTRPVTIESDRTYTIDSVTDALCTHSDMHTRIRVVGSTLPVIDAQSQRVQIRRGQSAVLSVSTSTPAVTYQWFEGIAGDTSAPLERREHAGESHRRCSASPRVTGCAPGTRSTPSECPRSATAR